MFYLRWFLCKLFAIGFLSFAQPVHAQTQLQTYPYDLGLDKARTESKWVMVKFERQDCVYCAKMTREIRANEVLRQLLYQHFIWVQVDQQGQRKVKYKHRIMTEAQLTQELKSWHYPYLLFLKSDGTPVGSVIGYQAPQTLQQLLRYVSSEAYTKMGFTDYQKSDMLTK